MVQLVDPVRERILREATRLFAERGYAGTPIGAVAEAVGVTKPTLVYHFGNKEGLREAVLSGIMDHWRDTLPTLMAAAATPGGGGPRLDALIGALFDFFRARPALARLVLREMLDRPVEMEALLRLHMQPWTTLLTQALVMGQQIGRLRPGVDPGAFTVLVISSAIGVVASGPHPAALVSPEPDPLALQAELTRMARISLLSPKE